MAGFGTGRLVIIKFWKGGEIGQGLDLAEISAWLLVHRRSARNLTIGLGLFTRGLGLFHQISFLVCMNIVPIGSLDSVRRNEGKKRGLLIAYHFQFTVVISSPLLLFSRYY